MLIATGGFLQEMEKRAHSVLTPSSYSASSVYQDHEDSMAHRAHLDVFNSQDETPRAWCPARPVQDGLTEWLQIEFDSLKLVKMLITRGRGPNTGEFVPAFYMKYQRDNGGWYDYVSGTGQRLIPANTDSSRMQTIPLSPPVTVRRFRLFPYQKSVARSMCLQVAALGYSFDDHVLQYEIPEGDVYHAASGNSSAVLNDSVYDGIFASNAFASNLPDIYGATSSTVSDQSRSYLRNGLGVLMDKSFFLGNISSVLRPTFDDNVEFDSSSTPIPIVGWFCRSGLPPSTFINVPCNSRNVTLLFKFDSVRQFSGVSIHALNSHREQVSVFRKALIQFSVGGRFFDRHESPIMYEHERDTRSLLPRWIYIPLERRIGAFVRITLTFDFDWIVLSEIAFNSTGVNKTVEVEKESSMVQSPPFLLETTVLPTFSPGQSADNRSRLSSSSGDLNTEPVVNFVPQSPAPLQDTTEFTYVIVVIVCCLGLLLIAGLLFFLCRKVHQRRQLRLKKKNPKRLLSPQPHHTQGNFHQCTPNPGALCAGPGVLGATSMPTYCLANNSVASTASTGTGAHQGGVDSRYSAFANGIGPEDLMKLQMMQHQQSSNYDSSLSFASPMSLMLRGGCYLDPYSAAPSERVPVSDLSRQPLAPIMSPLLPAPPPASSVALAAPSSISAMAVPQQPPSHAPTAVAAATPGFYPPPPDQPLPPLPPATPISASAANSLLSSGARNSTINPYAASSLNGFLVDDNGMVMSTHTDGSMAEYASASLVNGQTGRLPIRPPSIHGLSPGFSCQQQPQLQSQQPPTASSPNAGMMCLVSSGAGPVLNNVGGGLQAVANAGAYPFMLTAGYLARLPTSQGATLDSVLFPASEQHPAATCAANTWYPANYASEHLPPLHSNKRAPAFISSDTLRSIDTLPRDSPSISHPPPVSFCQSIPSRFPPNNDNNGEAFESTCAQR